MWIGKSMFVGLQLKFSVYGVSNCPIRFTKEKIIVVKMLTFQPNLGKTNRKGITSMNLNIKTSLCINASSRGEKGSV